MPHSSFHWRSLKKRCIHTSISSILLSFVATHCHHIYFLYILCELLSTIYVIFCFISLCICETVWDVAFQIDCFKRLTQVQYEWKIMTKKSIEYQQHTLHLFKIRWTKRFHPIQLMLYRHVHTRVYACFSFFNKHRRINFQTSYEHWIYGNKKLTDFSVDFLHRFTWLSFFVSFLFSCINEYMHEETTKKNKIKKNKFPKNKVKFEKKNIVWFRNNVNIDFPYFESRNWYVCMPSREIEQTMMA